MPQNIIPVFTTIDPPNATPGSTVSVTVQLNLAPAKEQVVDIVGAPAGAFSSLPSQVTVPSTANQAVFSATLSQSASGAVSVTATCNGVSAVGNCLAESSSTPDGDG